MTPWFSSTLAAIALAAVLPAQTPRLITDLETSPQTNLDSDPLDPMAAGTLVYFSAESATTGRELYYMDGLANVGWVGDIWPGVPGSDPVPLAEINNQLLFQADDGVHGRELWRTSPLASLGDLNPGTGSSDPTVLGRLGNTILLSADDGVHGRVLWSTTGGVPSLVSTVLVSGPSAVVGNTLLFVGSTGATGSELWKTDGTPGGTALVRDLSPGSTPSQFLSGMVTIQPNVYFVAGTKGGIIGGLGYTYDLWVTDGTSANTRLLTIRPGGGASPDRLAAVGTTLMFFADDGTHGKELWRANGSTVSLAADIRPGAASSNPDFATVALGTQFYFWADDGVHGAEPWTYSTVTGQAQLFADLAPGALGTNPSGGIGLPATGRVYFGASLPSSSPDLWELDPFTSTATRITLSFGTFGPSRFAVNGSQFAFQNDSGIWISGGTQATTNRVSTNHPSVYLPLPTLPGFFIGKGEPYWYANGTSPWLLSDIWQPPAGATNGSSPTSVVELHGQLLFEHRTASAGTELWRTDGTAAGTVLVKDILPGAESSSPRLTMRFGEHLFGHANAGSHFWRTDGTSAGTVEIPKPGGGIWFQTFTPAAVLNGRMIFAANGELWQSDGTSAGTGILRDINPIGDSFPSDFTLVGSTLFFRASDGTGAELWKTDGTFAGTVRVADIAPQGSSNPSNFAAVGSTLFFTATTSTLIEGAELWKSDGTAAGTVRVKDIVPGLGGSISPNSSQAATAGGVLVFVARDENTHLDYEVWRSDGTESGTFQLADIYPGTTSSAPRIYPSAFGLVYFTADSPATGRELWETDGTIAGTRLVANINPGAYGSDPSGLRQVGSRYLWFSAIAPGVGRELFAYEPFSQVLVPMGDFRPGTGSGNPVLLTVAGPNLVVYADDGLHGSELFVLDDVATSYSFGTGCGPSPEKPGLLVNDPRLGGSWTFSVFGLPPGEASLLVLGTRAFPPPLLAPGCAFYVDEQFQSAFFISGTTSFVHQIPIPNDPSLIGFTAAAQAGSLSVNNEFRVTNGVQSTIGL